LGRENQIAVLTVFHVVAVVAVDGIDIEHGNAGHFIAQLEPLVEKWSFWIIILGVIFGIPAVSPPDMLIVDGEGSVLRINGDYRFAATATRSFIQSSFIPKC